MILGSAQMERMQTLLKTRLGLKPNVSTNKQNCKDHNVKECISIEEMEN